MTSTYTFVKALALAWALATDPTSDTAEDTCSEHWAEDGDGWWDCRVALETWRCEQQGWCAPGDGEWLQTLPNPARPGQAYVTNFERHFDPAPRRALFEY